MFVPTATDCPGHIYTVDRQTFDWPGAPNSEAWIPSDCLDDSYQLIYRKCERDEWTPDAANFESLCSKKMFKGLISDVLPTDACYEVTKPTRNCFYYTDSFDNECSPGHISFTELSIDEREELLSGLSRYIGTSQMLFVNGGTNRWPDETISSLTLYKAN